jgi:hypothetical protein
MRNEIVVTRETSAVMQRPVEQPKSKHCTKKKKCPGTMTWIPKFRELGPNGGPPYRPAWVCNSCGKHDYAKGE